MATLKEKFGKFELSKEQVKAVKGGMYGAVCEDDNLYFADTYEALIELINSSTDNKHCILIGAGDYRVGMGKGK
jgi:hypothetical protein